MNFLPFAKQAISLLLFITNSSIIIWEPRDPQSPGSPGGMFANSGRARAHSHGHAHDCRHGHARGFYHGHKKHIIGIAHGYSHRHAHYILAVPMTLSMGTIAISGWMDS